MISIADYYLCVTSNSKKSTAILPSPLLIKFNQIVISNLICEKRERKKGKRLLPSGLSQIMRSCHKRIIFNA